MRDVTDKVAFITGGASGIGLGMARAFLAAGMRVAVVDVRADHLEAARAVLPPDRCAFFQLDVTDRAAMALAADEVEATLGGVDILCNNAGVGMLGNIRLVTYDDWDWCLGINLGGAVNGVQTFLPRMLARGGEAHIVNTSSIGAILPGPNGVPYLTAKAAIIGLSETLRADLAPLGIGVTVLIPGPTSSNIHEVSALRPARYRDTGLGAVEDVLAKGPLFPDAMDPLVAGEMTLEAIRNDHPYVVTHGAFRSGVAERFAALLEAFPPANPAAGEAMGMLMASRFQELDAVGKAAVEATTRAGTLDNVGPRD